VALAEPLPTYFTTCCMRTPRPEASPYFGCHAARHASIAGQQALACLKCRLSWHRMGRAAAARPSSSSQTSMQQQRAEQQPCACAAIRTWHIILPAQRPALPYNSNSISKQQQQNDS
jgi:hypothetical protein